MPKKSESLRGGKSNNAHSQMKDRSQKPNRGEASYGGGGHQKKDREMKSSGDIGKAISGSGTSINRDDNAFDGIRNLSGGKKSKSGCFPKLLMLLLSITTGVAYFFFG